LSFPQVGETPLYCNRAESGLNKLAIAHKIHFLLDHLKSPVILLTWASIMVGGVSTPARADSKYLWMKYPEIARSSCRRRRAGLSCFEDSL